MIRFALLSTTGTALVLAWCTTASAQFSIARPKPTSIQQVSATTPSLAASRNALLPQIRVTIRYLMVDEPIREKIYASMPEDSSVTHANLPSTELRRHSPNTPESEPLVFTDGLHSTSAHRFSAPSRVTTSVLDSSQVQSILDLAAGNSKCEVSNAPAVIFIDGKEAEMNDVVQHPMVVNIQSESDVVHPTVRIFEDGIRLRMRSSLDGRRDDSDGILLSCEVNTSEILDVKTHKIYGVQEQPLTVQVPIHQVTSATVSARLAAGQTLLVDPHHSKESTITQDQGVPLLTKIPYVNRTFKNVGSTTVERSMLILLEPSVEQSDKTGP